MVQFFYKVFYCGSGLPAKLRKLALVLACATCWSISHAQIQRFPATVTPIVSAPYPVYLSDYIEPGSNKFTANVVFNDHNEQFWTFKLRLTIESGGIRLQTKDGFTPAVPITLSPGQPYSFTGSEWNEYFNFDNLRASGRNVAEIVKSGRLPEGMYSFCLQVLDYATGDPLSAEVCQTAWVQLMDPPRVISPACDSYVDPLVNTQLPFTWQLVNTISPHDAMGTQYRLTMWEITEAGANPMSAVDNGQVLQVYQSDILQSPSFVYGPAEPILETGKVYLYQVQALDPDGKDKFKNNGKSEYCYFYYGWPSGGKIEQTYPEPGQAFKRRAVANIGWRTPANKAPIQAVNYEVVIKEFDEDETPEDAILNNQTWYYRITESFTRNLNHSERLPYPDVEKGYAWQVKAFTNGQEVAKSDVSYFYGPPLVERFFAGQHRVEVDRLTVKDLNGLTGEGRIRLQNADVWTACSFANLKMRQNEDIFYLVAGEFFIDTEPISFELTGAVKENGTGVFEATRYRVNEKGLAVEGRFTWTLPFPLLSGAPARITTEKVWSNFNYFKVTGDAAFADNSSFDLLDPYGFQLNISKTSKVYLDGASYRLKLNGSVSPSLPVTTKGDRLLWSFADQPQLFLMEATGVTAATPLPVLKQAGITLLPVASVIDLSDGASPGKLAGEPHWKGIYLQEYELAFAKGLDGAGQLALNNEWKTTITANRQQNSSAWVTYQGLTLKETVNFSGASATISSFPASFKNLSLDIQNQYVNSSTRLTGELSLPFISTSKTFAFEAPADNNGFKPGYLTKIAGTQFTFNPEGGELAVKLQVKKAEFVGGERLQMTLDLEWPSLGVRLKGVNNFNIWGDYRIGFFKPEGIVALSHQQNATFRGYPVTIDALSAGRSSNYYGIAVSGKVVMGDDVSGDDGAPAFNLYSMVQNSLLSPNYTPAAAQFAVSLEGSAGKLAEIEAGLAALEEDLTQQIEQQTAALESATEDQIASAAASLGGQEYAVEEIVAVGEEAEEVDIDGIQDPVQRVLALIEYMKPFLNDPSAVDALATELRNMDDPGTAEKSSQVLLLIKKYARQFAIDQIASLGDGFLRKVDNVTYNINSKIAGEINKLTGTVHEEIDQAVGQIITNASAEVVASISQQAPNAAEVVEEIANSTRDAIVNEVVMAVNRSVNENIVFPVTSFISANLSERAHRLVAHTAEKVVFGLTSADSNPSDALKEVMGGVEDELTGLGEELSSQVDLNKALETMRSLGQDAVSNISAERIVARIKEGALEAIAGAVAAKASEAASELASKLLGEEIGISIPVDFGAAGAKLLSGGSPKDLLFDPIPVKVRSAALDLNGVIHFGKDDPLYGDVWRGDVTALVKVPSPFEIKVAYMNGRKDNVSFWLAEAGGAAGDPSRNDNTAQVGGEMSGEMQEVPSGLKLGAVEVMALRGRVFHHMKADKLAAITPDAGTRYGAYLHMIMFGPQQGRRMRLEVNAEMNTFATGDFTVAFDGNTQILNKNPQVNSIDPNAVILGTVSLKYNSAEKHFFGLASVVVNKPGVLCSEGSLLVDVKPGAWRVALGSQEDRLRFILACAGYGPTGWLDANQNTAQLGLGMEFLFFTTINLDVKIARVGLVIDAGAAAGVQATVQYNPDFALMEAGLWLELWARVLLSYEMGIKKGSVNLVDIYLAANANMRFHPAPTLLYGDLRGNIKVLFLEFGFDKEFQMNM